MNHHRASIGLMVVAASAVHRQSATTVNAVAHQEGIQSDAADIKAP
jgi:hypothetical protein